MDEVERQALRHRLEDLLDRRAELDPPDCPQGQGLGSLLAYVEASSLDPVRSRLLFRETVALAREILGDRVRHAVLPTEYRNGDDQRNILKIWLSLVSPLIQLRPALLRDLLGQRSRMTPFDVIDALSALEAGEIQPIFKAKTGRNRRANRWSLARAKLEALTWKKRLLALGYVEKAANYEVTIAFGEQWDTIRKWKGQCEQILGEFNVRAELEFAGSQSDPMANRRGGMFAATGQDALQQLKIAGENYKAELQRSAALSKRKSGSVDG